MTDATPAGSPPPTSDDPDSDGGVRVERSAGGVVVRPGSGGHQVLLIRDPYHKWGLPKGHLEEGESPQEAALREVREEAGLDTLVLGPDLGEIDWVFGSQGARVHKYCRFFLMASFEGRAEPQIDEGISECVWLPPEEALERIAYDNARGILVRGIRMLTSGPAPESLPWDDR